LGASITCYTVSEGLKDEYRHCTLLGLCMLTFDCHIGGIFSAVKNSWNLTKLNSDLDHCQVEISVHLLLLNPSKSGASAVLTTNNAPTERRVWVEWMMHTCRYNTFPSATA
jgi:hypothetical protein